MAKQDKPNKDKPNLPDAAAPDAAAPDAAAPDAAAPDAAAPDAAAPEAASADMVTVTVPKAYKLRLTHEHELNIKAGVQKMERSVAEHWYSIANGVTIFVE